MKYSIKLILFSVLAVLYLLMTANASSVPVYYNSVENGYVTPVKYQGKSGSCWAFAALSCLESDAIIKGYETVETADFSEAHVVWTTFTSSGLASDINNGECNISQKNNIYENSGDAWDTVSTLSKGVCITYEKDFPFNAEDLSKMGNYSHSEYYIKGKYSIGNTVELRSPDKTKEWIMKHGSVYIAFHSLNEDNYKYSEGYCYYSGEKTDNRDHAVTIVGWNDNYSKNNFVVPPPSDGAWLCKNSWGTEWGDNGYFWLSYCEPSLGIPVGYTINTVDYDNVYTYSAAPYDVIVDIPFQLSYANIYTAKNDEVLKNISFYSPSSECDINISVYKLNNNADIPMDGTEIYSTSYYAADIGYHNIKPDNDTIYLEKGKQYSVVINQQGETCSAVIENDKSKYYKYTSAPGQSFFSYNGGYRWKDAYTLYGNFYINIYTSDLPPETAKTLGNTDNSSAVTQVNKEYVNTVSEKKESITELKTTVGSDENINNNISFRPEFILIPLLLVIIVFLKKKNV